MLSPILFSVTNCVAIQYNQIIESLKNTLDEKDIEYKESVATDKHGKAHVFITDYGKGFCQEHKKKIYYYVLDNGKVNVMDKEGFDEDAIYTDEVWIPTHYYKFEDYLCGKRVNFSGVDRISI